MIGTLLWLALAWLCSSVLAGVAFSWLIRRSEGNA